MAISHELPDGLGAARSFLADSRNDKQALAEDPAGAFLQRTGRQ
jgi:hypothetical protein